MRRAQHDARCHAGIERLLPACGTKAPVSPGFRPEKPISGSGVLRSLPRVLLKAKNSFVTSTQTTRAPTFSAPSKPLVRAANPSARIGRRRGWPVVDRTHLWVVEDIDRLRMRPKAAGSSRPGARRARRGGNVHRMNCRSAVTDRERSAKCKRYPKLSFAEQHDD
jgi:hypothetical protein